MDISKGMNCPVCQSSNAGLVVFDERAGIGADYREAICHDCGHCWHWSEPGEVINLDKERNQTMYKIVRMYQDPNKSARTIETGLTLAEAREHCRDPETSSKTCTTYAGRRRTRLHGPWLDGYEET